MDKNKSKGLKPKDARVKDQQKQQRKNAKKKMKKQQTESDQLKRGKQVAQGLHFRGVAPVASLDPSQVTVPSNLATINRSVLLSANAVTDFALAIVNLGLKRGFIPTFNDATNSSYFSYVITYIRENLSNAANSTRVEGTELPKFMWEVQEALMPKKLPFKMGEIQYTPQFTGEPVIASQYRYAVDTQGTEFYNIYGVTDGGNVLGFPVIDNTVGGYDRDFAGKLMPGLWSTLKSQTTESTLCDLVPFQEYVPSTKRDSSAFAAVFPERGRSFDSVGGIRTTLGHEVRIPCPLLSKFINDSEGANAITNRGVFQFHPSGGTAAYLATRMIELPNTKSMRNKAVPIFKFYEFHEIVESLALWIGGVLEIAERSPNVVQPPPYPLTALQFAILIRQAIIRNFNNEAAQSLTTVENTLEELPWVLFSVGLNGKQTEKNTIRIPMIHAETIASVVRYKQTVAPNYVVDHIPLLGTKYTDLDYNTVNYVWGSNNTPVFQQPGATTINLVDCHTLVNNNRVYLSLDSQQYVALVNAHNDWVMSVASYSSPLCDLAQTVGVPVMYQNLKTRITRRDDPEPSPAPGPQPPTRKNSKKINIGEGLSMKKMIKLGPAPSFRTPSEDLKLVGTTSLMPFLSATSNFDGYFWFPAFTYLNGGLDVSAYRAFMMEANFKAAGQFNTSDGITKDYQTLYDVNLRRAQADLKQIFTEPSEQVEALKELQREGEGSFLSTIASLFGPGIGAIGHAIDQAF